MELFTNKLSFRIKLDPKNLKKLMLKLLKLVSFYQKKPTNSMVNFNLYLDGFTV